VVIPISAMSGAIPYPGWEEIKAALAQYTDRIYLVPATRIGKEVKNPKALNMVLMGALAAFMDLDDEIWLEDIRRKVPPKFLDSSLEAFHKGAKETKSMKQKGVSK